MTISPAQRHRANVEAAKATTGEEPPVNQQYYRAFHYKMNADLERINRVPSGLDRNKLKRELLPEYADFLEPLLQSGNTGKNNDVFAWLLIWNVDTAQYEQALQLLTVALANDLKPPRLFTARRLPEIVVEDMANAIIPLDEPQQHSGVLLELEEKTRQRSMPDYIRAKLLKALGMSFIQQDSAKALEWLKQSQTYNPKGGVKAHIKRIEKRMELAANPKRSKRKPTPSRGDAKFFDLSARKAAALLGVCPQKFNKVAETEGFEYFPLPYGKDKIAKRYKSTEIKKYVGKTIVNKDLTMNADSERRKALYERIVGELEFDAGRAVRRFAMPEGCQYDEQAREGFILSWINEQTSGFGDIDFGSLDSVAEIEPLLLALNTAEPMNNKVLTEAYSQSFAAFFPDDNGAKLRAYMVDKVQDILIEHDLLPRDKEVTGRVLEFEYPTH